jgi:Beta-lactamase
VDLVRLGTIHVGPGAPSVLPAADAAQMRQAVPEADPFGLADGWGMGLAVYRQRAADAASAVADADAAAADAAADWVGHDGNGDGTSAYLRINPAAGWVIALTANANTGAGLWRDLLAVLAGAGVPIGADAGPRAPVTPTAPPPGCAGRYANGDAEYVVVAGPNASLRLSVDGENFAPVTLHEDLSFAVYDPASGRDVFGGRFVREPATGKVCGIQVGGRMASRQLFRRAATVGRTAFAPTG